MYFKALSAVLSFVLLMPSSPVTINNAVSISGITNIVADQVTNYKDLTFDYLQSTSTGTISTSGDNKLSAHDVYLTSSATYLRCTTWDSTAGACKVYQLSASPSSASTVHINEDDQSITLNLSESNTVTYKNPRYSWVQEDVIKIAFNDGKLHTGKLNISPSQGYYGYQSDNDNVTAIGTTVYFFNVGSFEIQHQLIHSNQNNLNNTSYDYTVSNLVEYECGSLDELISIATMNTYTTQDFNRLSATRLFMNLGASELVQYQEFYWLQGTLSQGYNSSATCRLTPGTKFYVTVFADNVVLGNSGSVKFYNSSGEVSNIASTLINSNTYSNGLRLFTYMFINNNDSTMFVTPVWTNTNAVRKYIPLYMGTGADLDQATMERYGIIKEVVSDEVSDSQNSLNNFNNQFQTVNQNEQNAINDFNENINNLDFNPPSGQSFVSSANFFKRIFTDFVGSTPLFTPIAVALMITLTMLILGAL